MGTLPTKNKREAPGQPRSGILKQSASLGEPGCEAGGPASGSVSPESPVDAPDCRGQDSEEAHGDLANYYQDQIQSAFRGGLSLPHVVASLERDTFGYSDPETAACSAAVERLLRDLLCRIAATDPVFKDAVIFKVGSFWDGTRVSCTANEFDFMVSLESRHIRVAWSDGGAARDWIPKGWLVLASGEASRAWSGKPFLSGKAHGCDVIQPYPLYRYFLSLVEDALCDVTLSPGLAHGGLLPPRFTRLSRSVPAVTLDLKWKTSGPVTVDATIGFPVPLEFLTTRTRESVGRLHRASGVPNCPVHPVHLVSDKPNTALRARWLPTSSVLETWFLGVLGPDSKSVRTIRALKLLARRFLQWRPLAKDVSDAIAALNALVDVGDSTPQSRLIRSILDLRDPNRRSLLTRFIVAMGPRGTSRVRVVGVYLEGLAQAVSVTLTTGRLQIPTRAPSEPFQVHVSRRALVTAAAYRAHRNRDHGPGDCTTCLELIREARDVDPAMVCPALGEALGLGVKPWVDVRSAYLKYLVLADIMGQATPPPRPAADATPLEHPDDKDLLSFLQRLSDDLSGILSGVEHPLLGVGAILPAIHRKRQGKWETPYRLQSAHADLAKRLLDLLQDRQKNTMGPVPSQ